MAEVGTYYIQIMPEMSKFSNSVRKSLGAAGGKDAGAYSSSFAAALKGSALGVAIGNFAMSAGNMIMSGLDAGIKRLDTLKNYPSVMEQLGYSAEEASASIGLIREHLDGLPTSTDSVVRLTQAIADSTGDLDLATKAALGFNDMLLANGASAQEATTAQDMFNRILGKQNATVNQWMSLQSVMPSQLRAVAEQMLGAGHSSEELRDALNEGTVSWNDFLQAVADLDETRFEDQARAMTGGIGTALDNFKNRIAAGWEAILDVFGQTSISGIIDKTSYGVRDAMKGIAEALQWLKDAIAGTSIGESLGKIATAIGDTLAAIFDGGPSLVQSLAESLIKLADGALKWLADHGDLVSAAVGAIVGALAAMLGFDLAKWSVSAVAGIKALSAALMANPAMLIVGGIAALIMALATFFTQTETGKKIWKGFVDALKKFWNDLKTSFKKTFDQIKQNLETSALVWQNFKAKVANLVTELKQKVSQAWQAIKTTVTNLTSNLVTAVTSAWNNLKSTVSNAVNILKTNVTTAWTNLKTTVTNTVNGIKTTVTSTWESIRSTVRQKVEDLKTGLSEKWESIRSTARQAIEDMKSGVIDKFNAIKTGASERIQAVRDAISSTWSGLTSTVSGIFDGVKRAITNPIDTAKQAVSDAISAIKGFFDTTISFPHINLPHFHVSGGVAPWGLGGKGEPPSFWIEWYKRGGVFNSPAIIGIGEGGKEAALPLNSKTYGEIARGIASQGVGGGVLITGNEFIIRQESDIRRVAYEIDRMSRRERWAMA